MLERSTFLWFIRGLPIPNEFLLDPAIRAAIAASRDAAVTQTLLRGDALFEALNKAVDNLKSIAPKEHDVLVEACGIYVTSVGFIEPHAFIFKGYDDAGNDTFVVAHFSQVIARVIYSPKRGPEKILTGFWREKKPD